MPDIDIERPKVGLGLFVVRDDLVLLGKRKGAHWEGEFGGPGGHLEGGERLFVGASREFEEEVGDDIRIKDLGLLCVTNITDRPPHHYIDFGIRARWVSGEPEVMEQDKIDSWGWYPIDEPPEPLMPGMENYLTAYRLGKVCFFENSELIQTDDDLWRPNTDPPSS